MTASRASSYSPQACQSLVMSWASHKKLSGLVPWPWSALRMIYLQRRSQYTAGVKEQAVHTSTAHHSSTLLLKSRRLRACLAKTGSIHTWALPKESKLLSWKMEAEPHLAQNFSAARARTCFPCENSLLRAWYACSLIEAAP